MIYDLGMTHDTRVMDEYWKRVARLVLRPRSMTLKAAQVVIDAAMFGIGCVEGAVRESAGRAGSQTRRNGSHKPRRAPRFHLPVERANSDGGYAMSAALYVGDNVEVMRRVIPDASIQLTVTSPPYDNLREYNGFSWDFESVARELYRVTKPGGVVVWVVADATVNRSETGTSFRQALYFKECGFNLHDTMIWNKGKFSAVGALRTRYTPVFEYMFVFVKGVLGRFNPIKDRPNKTAGAVVSGRIRLVDGTFKDKSTIGKVTADFGQRFNIWEMCPQQDNNAHPAPFPESLARDHILSWSNPGDLVLDPFVGSGTTGKMAVLHGRDFIGIDISSQYVDLAKGRIPGAEVRTCENVIS